MRTLPPLGSELVKEIDLAWHQPQTDWARKRLLVVRLIAQHELTAEEIAKVAGVSRPSVFNYRNKVMAEGLKALLTRHYVGGREPLVRGALAEELTQKLDAGKIRRVKDAQAWLEKRARRTLGREGMRLTLKKLKASLKVPRKSHAKKDPAKAKAFKAELPNLLSQAVGTLAPGQDVRVWVLDEHRYGLLPVIRRVWGRRGVRVHAPYATRYEWGYLHEALEVDGANRAEFLFTPSIDQDIHAVFLKQIGESDPSSLHVVIADQAGFHLKRDRRVKKDKQGKVLVESVAEPEPLDARVPSNVRLLALPPYSPELNPVERLGDQIKDVVCNKLYPSLRKLENRLVAELRGWMNGPKRVASLIGDGWLLDCVNAGDPT
jgi:transposase